MTSSARPGGAGPKAETSASNPDDLSRYARNEYSQNGEDGILERLFQLISDDADEKWCVEFGAWDGVHLSNTYNLIDRRAWRGVVIEADPVRYADLLVTMSKHAGVQCLNAMVGFNPPGDLDTLLAATPIPKHFDLLSIDIDGNDFHVWEAVTTYLPKVVVVEYNPTIPPHIHFVQPRHPHVHQGSSALSLQTLAARKGYELVAVTNTNVIFVRRDLFPSTGITDNSLDALWHDRPYHTSLFQLYDGTIMLDGCTRLVWHDLDLGTDGLQVIPSFLRRCPAYFSPGARWAWRVWRRLWALRAR